MNTRYLMTTTAIVLTAGLAVSTAAQNDSERRDDRRQQWNQPQPDNGLDRNRANLRAADLRFMEFDRLEGTDVVNVNGEKLGTIDDLLIDSGSGEISEVVIRSGTVLGFGGTRVAIPFESFRFDAESEEVRMDMTKEQLETLPEYTPERWTRIEDSEGDDWMKLADRRSGRHGADPYAMSADKKPETTTIKGTVDRVRRFETGDNVEFVEIHIRAENTRNVRKVVLGPSWHVMSKPNAPMRGQEIAVKGFQLEGDRESRLVAKSMTLNGNTVELRDDQYKASWSSQRENARAMPRLISLDKLIGRDVQARDQDAGDISTAYVEIRSGRVTLIGIDPDQNLLGIGDTVRLVPLSALSMGKDNVRIDASLEEIERSVEQPDEANQLASDQMLRTIYAPFGVEPIMLRQRDQKPWNWNGLSSNDRRDRDERRERERDGRSGGN